MSVYRPRFVSQIDGSRHQWDNCTMASAAMALDRHTMGKMRSTGARMRACQFDQSGGTTLEAAATAWRRCYRQTLTVRDYITWNTLVAAIQSGRGAILCGWYASLPASARCQQYAAFNHAVYVNEIRSDGYWLVYDPLCRSSHWIMGIYMKEFAGQLRQRYVGRGWEVVGYGHAYAAFTRVTPNVGPPAPPPHPNPKPIVQPRFGGVAITPHTFHAKVAGRQRRSPFIRTDNVIRTVKAGTAFVAYQRSTKGTNVGGNTTWYGNQIGTVWMHSSLLK